MARVDKTGVRCRRYLRGVRIPPTGFSQFSAFVAGGGGAQHCLRLLFLYCCLVLVSPGCEDVRRDFFPLAAGNSWTYRVRSEGRDLGTESLRVTEELAALAPREADRERRRAPRRFRVEEPGGPALWLKEDGTVVRSSGRATSIVLQHPPLVGTGWTDEAPSPTGTGDGIVYCKVIAREPIQTPAGWFFDCVVVRREAEDRSSIVTQWLAPDFGLVRWRVERPERPDVLWELEKYGIERE